VSPLRLEGYAGQAAKSPAAEGDPFNRIVADQNFAVPAHRFKMLWDRFLTAINSAGPQPVIVVTPLEKQRDASKNYSHHALTPAEK
jgi:hypothetical protein